MLKKKRTRKGSFNMMNSLLWLWLIALWGSVLLLVMPGGLDLYNPVKATAFVILAALFPFIFAYYKNKNHEGLSFVMSPGTVGMIAFAAAIIVSFSFAIQKQDALWGVNMSIGDGLVFYLVLVLVTILFLSFPMRSVSVLVRYTLVVLGVVILAANVIAIGALLGMFEGWLNTNGWAATHLSFLDNRLFHPTGGVLHGLLLSAFSMFIYVRLWFKKDPFSLLLALVGGAAAAIVFIVYAAAVPFNQLLWYVLVPMGAIVVVSIVGIVQAATPRTRWFITFMALAIVLLGGIGAWASGSGVYKQWGFKEQTNIVNITFGDSLVTAYNQFSQGKSGLGRSLVGAGMGTYQYIYSAYRPETVAKDSEFALVFYKAANYPLTLLSTIGLLGVGVFLFILVYAGRMAIMGINHVSGHLSTITVGWGVLFWIFVTLITFGSVPITIMLWLMMGLLIALWFKHHKLSRHLVGLKFQVEDASIQVNRQREGLHIITWVVWPLLLIWLFWQMGTITLAQMYSYRADARYNEIKNAQQQPPKIRYQQLNEVIALNDKGIATRYDFTELHHRRAVYLLDQYQLVEAQPDIVGENQAEGDLTRLMNEMEKEFNIITTRNSYDFRYWYTMFLSYRAHAIHTKGKQGLDNAVRSIREALRVNQYELNLRVEYANFLLLLEDQPAILNEAMNQVSFILTLNKSFVRAYLPLARIFEKQKKYDRAIETYTSLMNSSSDQGLKDTLKKKITELEELQKKANQTPAKNDTKK